MLLCLPHPLIFKAHPWRVQQAGLWPPKPRARERVPVAVIKVRIFLWKDHPRLWGWGSLEDGEREPLETGKDRGQILPKCLQKGSAPWARLRLSTSAPGDGGRRQPPPPHAAARLMARSTRALMKTPLKTFHVALLPSKEMQMSPCAVPSPMLATGRGQTWNRRSYFLCTGTKAAHS